MYASYPFPATLGFDEGFLHGEIVRLLMAEEAFAGPRLEACLIWWVQAARPSRH